MHFRLTTVKHYLKYVIRFGIIILLYLMYSKNKSEHIIEHYENDILSTPKNYNPKYLHEWVPASVVREVSDLPGELGKPVILPESMKEEVEIKFKEHEFNIVISDMISLNRSLGDRRDPLCLNVKYLSTLPTTSIIIIFHNEAWSTLLRTLWSIINQSPKGLVKEIILVDDKSSLEFLGEQLDEYVKTLPIHTKVLRMEERLGLITARLRGAEIAKGEVLTFLDAHIECTEGWLEPLLSSVAENRRVVAIPIIDIIKDDTFEYIAAYKGVWGGFDWKLGYKWVPIPERERKRTGNSPVAPLHTPTMPGGLFSIDREFFYEIGSYDEGMIIWGSENLEMSFRVWMCGGLLLKLPCSRVGHIYRKKTPYSFPGKGASHVVAFNCNRLVNVWLDDWISTYYLLNPDRRNVDFEDVSSRIALRKQLNCKSFQWYVNNIYPEVDFPKGSKYIGRIQSVEAQGCLVSYIENQEAVLHICHDEIVNQVFVLTEFGQIRNDELCMDANAAIGSVKVRQCNPLEHTQKWEYNPVKQTFKHYTGSCLQRDNHPTEPWVMVKRCDGSSAQQWLLTNNNYEPGKEL